MSRGVKCGLVVAALLAGLGCGYGAAPAATPGTKDAAVLQKIAEAMDKRDCPTIQSLGEPLLRGRKVALPEEAEAALNGILANCALASDATDKAYAYLLRGTRLSAAPDQMWHLRLLVEIEAKRYPAAVSTVEEMSQGRGAALNATPVDLIAWLSRDLKDKGLKGERKRLFRVLASDGYAPAETGGDAQGFQLGYARLLADDGDVEAARPYLARVTDGRLLSEAWVDPKLRTLLPTGFDLRAAAEAGLARDRQAWERHPDKLALLVTVGEDLRRLGRPQETITALEAVLPRLAEKGSFTDIADRLPWYWDVLGRANGALDRYDEGVRAFSTGAALKEGASPNVSQVINLGYLQLRYGRNEEALKTVAAFAEPGRKASPYGEMEMRTVRVCANAALGRSAAASADLAYAQAHEKENPDALGYIYLCLDRMDDAAGFFIRRLDDPDTRTEILLQMSDFDPPVGPLPRTFGARLARLKARADVRTALDRAGGVRRIPLQPDSI